MKTVFGVFNVSNISKDSNLLVLGKNFNEKNELIFNIIETLFKTKYNGIMFSNKVLSDKNIKTISDIEINYDLLNKVKTEKIDYIIFDNINLPEYMYELLDKTECLKIFSYSIVKNTVNFYKDYFNYIIQTKEEFKSNLRKLELCFNVDIIKLKHNFENNKNLIIDRTGKKPIIMFYFLNDLSSKKNNDVEIIPDYISNLESEKINVDINTNIVIEKDNFYYCSIL